MQRIAVSGHRGLNDVTAHLIDQAMRDVLTPEAPGLTGLSCLADGADQIFARVVLDLGGQIEVIIPAEQYRDALPEHAHPEYDELLALAAEVHRMPFRESSPESHMVASEYMLDLANNLIAVWDGKPARAFGGTADVVAAARQRGIRVRIIWPPGAERG